jgi:hypothetical protein
VFALFHALPKGGAFLFCLHSVTFVLTKSSNCGNIFPRGEIMKKLLFSVTKKDFELQFFCAGGKGGQNQNKVATACRIIHAASGAVGESRTHRTQLQNKKEAFSRLLSSKEFKLWHKIQCSRSLGLSRLPEEIVEEQMQDKFLKIEYI